jgi:RNA polymerase sigma-70 factor (ECF subfamily)
MDDITDRIYEGLLVVRCKTGDESAFGELVARYGPRLHYFLRKMVGPAAEDVAQDVWCDVYRGVPRLAEPAAFPAWFYRIARDRAYRVIRRRHHATCPIEDAGEITRDREVAFTAEDAAAVHAALDKLAPEHREVLVLRFLEEMGYDEIARVVGCPVGTVRSRLHYAKAALAAVIERASDDGRQRPG